MLSMANLSSSDSLQQPWSNSQSKNNSQLKSVSHSAQSGKKAGGGGGGNGKQPSKHPPKKPRKSSSIESLDYDDDQDHMDACFKDSDYGERRRGGGRTCTFVHQSDEKIILRRDGFSLLLTGDSSGISTCPGPFH